MRHWECAGFAAGVRDVWRSRVEFVESCFLETSYYVQCAYVILLIDEHRYGKLDSYVGILMQ